MKEETIKWLSQKYSKDEKFISVLMKINEIDGETEERSIELINAFFEKVCNKVCSREEEIKIL